jgi:hypothetical protein
VVAGGVAFQIVTIGPARGQSSMASWLKVMGHTQCRMAGV